MNSILFIHENSETSLKEALAFTKNRSIHQFDLTLIDPTLEGVAKKTAEATSIGIETVKKLKQSIFLKPSQGQEKAVIIANAHLLTIPAQNALLKVLEEPPASTYLLLTTTSEDALLPTILSRCSVIPLSRESEEIQHETKELVLKDYLALPSLPLPALLKKAEQLAKNKQAAQSYLRSLTTITREELLTHLDDTTLLNHHLLALKNLTQTQKLINLTNTNLRLALENFFLTFK